MKVDKEITKTLRKNEETYVDMSKEATNLLLDAHNEEQDILKSVGLDYHITTIESRRGEQIEREQFEKKYGHKIISEEEIKNICMKYDLRFLPAKLFIGKIDATVGPKLARFVKEHSNEMGSNNSNDFFIIAPAEVFKMEENTVSNDILEEKRERKRREAIEKDPALFYRIPKTKLYIYIHKWGKDFTFWRRIRGVYFNSVGSQRFFTANFLFLAHLIIFKLICPESSIILTSLHCLSYLAYIPISLLVNLIITASDSKWWMFTTENMWNKNQRRSLVTT